MIGSFWNLCRACPSMPVDKQLHSEYRSTYRWHEFTGNARPEVVRRAPAPNPSQFVGPTNEPPLPRRKKCPELAYKSHEFIIGTEYTDVRNNRMARSEERGGTPSRRSKSEGPPIVPNGRAYPISTEIDGPASKQAGESSTNANGLIKKTITKLSTEYRCKFVWPNVRHRIAGHESNDAVDYPRKSISLGAIRSQPQHQQQQQQQQQHQYQQQKHAAGMPTVHKKRTTNQKEATLHELEPLVSDADERKPHEKQVTIVERKMTSRPFSQSIDQERINHFITKKENFGFDPLSEHITITAAAHDMVDNKQKGAVTLMNGSAPPYSHPNLDLWHKEMVELRKKADEYKCRGWGIEIDPDLYKKQKELWEQVSKRSSLSALSLASSVHRPISKEEKENENNKKSIPISKSAHKPRVPGQAYLIDNKDEMIALPARFSHIRHHLERTTGPDVEEGALLPSPTREKLMPAITKRESESQRGSPKKTAASRHGSPQKGSPQKGSPKKVAKTRSQSVGPGDHELSPKRQIRSASTAPTARQATGVKRSGTTRTSDGTGATAERRPRPSTLSTTFQSRTKSSSLPPTCGRAIHSVPAANQQTINHLNQSQSSQSNEISSKMPQQLQQQQQQQQREQQKLKTQTQNKMQTIPMRKKDKERKNISSVCGGITSVPAAASASGGKINPITQKAAKERPKSIATIGSIGIGGNAGGGDGSGGGGGGGGRGRGVGGVSATAATTKSTGGGGAPFLFDNGVDPNMAKSRLAVPGQDNKLAENDSEDGHETAISISSCSPQPPPEMPQEPIVKSPPEPTRVKSPEQIIMRSPDPVNWTVPLDTGKTFTVTQNIRNGENYSRPQSEIKASTPVEKPPPPPQSAPPELTEQAKMDAWKRAEPMSSLLSATAAVIGNVTTTQPTAGAGGLPPAAPHFEGRPVPGSTLRVLEDPIFDVDITAGGGSGSGGGNTSSSSTSTTTNTALSARTKNATSPTATGTAAIGIAANAGTGSSSAATTAADVLEKARDRFDRFWGGNKEDHV